MSGAYWLIEYRRDGRTIAYVQDAIYRNGGFDVILTDHSSQALRFNSEHEATAHVNGEGYIRLPTPPAGDSLVVEGHLDCAGPTHAEIDAESSRSADRCAP